ncbi:TIGR03621 family F420-dependent LLM class oxidoreductase [Microbispora hainanensis]|jgi:probable F420-dependent oxidoreductase|uniref:TIGR03621 family F420-dependent LLM class oxidoreductase n=1 Tax=Microbispora hainanensis TaxID=568844 RepID=A0ABZ1SI87_9ACTN|nr:MULTISPECIES: TIGR03621 family F420-dependent LLM class oxidoreductase [Microbispora]NJP25519.1 TIGR03621 family F420-dependent LLM class oxidoreductase [Microbispora sp. CL1-1]TQS13475.1 TIGR03621 family F420-dependent LLM class oxidoreductase [Microbispora sp. SCL1-1]
MSKEFRFGIVAGMAPDAAAWTATARHAEDLGYSTLLVPDTLGTLPPLLAMTAAATVTTTLRVGTFVLAAPYRNPPQLAHELAGLDFLSGGRLEVGVGAGRPAAEEDARALGMPYGTAAERIAQVRTVISEVRTAFAGTNAFSKSTVQRQGPPIMIAGAGPRMLALAAEEADIVALAVQADTTEEGLRGPIGTLRAAAGARFDDVELSMNLLQIGDEPPPWVPEGLRTPSAEAAAILRGSPREMADTLLRRRDELGLSYITVGGFFADALAPVVELLAGS